MNIERTAVRKSLEGCVVKDKMDKTRVVKIQGSKRHPLYQKVIKRSLKVFAHDEKNETKTGDHVLVMETRPMSKLKRWRIVEKLKKV